ncbi:MAG TPA: sugar MFS transporter [Gammaproteobacteria bacterium]|nr:sugar MFS transporter [Gammaproteobacteria bacterium]
MTDETARVSSAAAAARERSYFAPLVALTSLFFMWGLITSLNDILIPHLKAAFTLNYVQATLIQLSFFGAYFVMSMPSGWLVERIGYKRGIIIGLLVAALGCLAFYPAAAVAAYPLFLGALFVLASGITLLQVAANPYVTILGPTRTASSRLTLTQAFNSFGTTVGPRLGSRLILASATVGTPAAEAALVQKPYLGLAAVLVVIAIVFMALRLPAVAAEDTAVAASSPSAEASIWSHRHLVLGVAAIFVYVGGEVAIGSLLVNFMADPSIAGFAQAEAGDHVSYYWGAAMVGRFVGAGVMLFLRPGRVLAFNGVAVVVLLLTAMGTAGTTAMWCVLAVGFFNSIMFPTIFALALAGLGRRTGEGSGMLCMAIVGGAVVPVIQGYFADHIGILQSFVVPLVCYLYIVFYGLYGHRPARA